MEIAWPNGTADFVGRDTLLRFEEKVVLDEATGCWFWTAATQGKGYGSFWSGGPKGVGKLVKAHRWMWEVFNGPTELHVLHSCDTPPCVNPAHLFVGTNADNVADKIAKGRSFHPWGEALPQCRLTDAQIAEIRSRYKGPQHRHRPRTGPTMNELAAEFGIRQSHIDAILKGRKRRFTSAT